MEWTGKKVVVLGLGKSGFAAAQILQQHGAEVVVRDESRNEELLHRAEELRKRGVTVELAEAVALNRNVFDLGILSPGIDPRRPLVNYLEGDGVPLWSELELAYRFCECPIVAVTGTNGKTTTTELIHAVLLASGKRSCAAGNIGLALSEVVQKSYEYDVFVVEASSYQLERIVEFHPRIAALLNLTADHMDRYSSMEAYLKAKLRIFENQDQHDFAIFHARFGKLKVASRPITFSARGESADYTLEQGFLCRHGRKIISMERLQLQGLHNAENALVALAAGHLYDVSETTLVEALAEFQPTAHRCERIATIDGVTYINDSKATNPDAVAMALEGQTSPVVLIAGGKDKGFEFDSIADVVIRKTRAVVLIGETAPKLARSWSKANCVMANSFRSAIETARSLANSGDVVLLSPACSSFDMFRDYVDRGNQFKEVVRNFQQSKKPNQ